MRGQEGKKNSTQTELLRGEQNRTKPSAQWSTWLFTPYNIKNTWGLGERRCRAIWSCSRTLALYTDLPDCIGWKFEGVWGGYCISVGVHVYVCVCVLYPTWERVPFHLALSKSQQSPSRRRWPWGSRRVGQRVIHRLVIWEDLLFQLWPWSFQLARGGCVKIGVVWVWFRPKKTAF